MLKNNKVIKELISGYHSFLLDAFDLTKIMMPNYTVNHCIIINNNRIRENLKYIIKI